MSKKFYSIAIDGPAAAGKTTTAKRLAAQLGFVYCDTGALYRALAVGIIDAGRTDPKAADFAEFVKGELPYLDVSLEMSEKNGQVVMLNGVDLTPRLRTEEVSAMASAASAIPEVRLHLDGLQRDVARNHDVVMEGRDIGTVILPDADVKIFLSASISERATRRGLDLSKAGTPEEPIKIAKELMLRDRQDSNRSTSPLKQAEDAIFIDNTSMSIDETVGRIMQIAENRIGRIVSTQVLTPGLYRLTLESVARRKYDTFVEVHEDVDALTFFYPNDEEERVYFEYDAKTASTLKKLRDFAA